MIQGLYTTGERGKEGESLDDMWLIGILKHLLVAP